MRSTFKFLAVLVLIAPFTGIANSALAQGIFGHWNPIMHEDSEERGPGPFAGDYAGLPINQAARTRAETWQASLLTLPEHQCKPHPSTYGFRGVGNLFIWQELDPVSLQEISIGTHIRWQAQRRTIWMDGREHPDAMAPHSWQGFSTGHWEGDTLVVRTTHLKAGWMRRNGLAFSDQAVMTERFIPHGDKITHIYMIEDPVYLDGIFFKSNGFDRRELTTMAAYPCRSATEVPREAGDVPHYLPGESPYSVDFAQLYGIPEEAGQGGGNTMRPEYMHYVREWRLENLTREERYGDGISPIIRD
ncbi:MAG: hypothetical protein CMP91_07970 [Gammaproteobacteria bacterium]|nr:hypothetical protein [Gammaproteobacteria bacterium]MAY03551.1 hypothetical protein [Gammaproteobacteria bacterium]|tara:strand:+ start:228457 stop:229365 length:909 start_codon:yes stop_codon:yes gene_type:complete